MPWLVPVKQPLELTFFHKVFTKLRESMGITDSDDEDELEDEPEDRVNPRGVPLLVFQRAMSRLFRVLQDDRTFDACRYDLNGDGTVGWWEFCVLWKDLKDEQLSVKLSTAERIFLTLEDPQASRLGRICSIFVLMTILVSSGGFVLSTLPSMQEQSCDTCAPEPFESFVWIDTVCVILFTIEYMLRLCTAAFMRMELTNQDEIISNMCTEEVIHWPTKAQRVWDFMRSIPNLIDLVAILPSYILWFLVLIGQDPEDGSSSNELLRLIRLMRVFRAFRLGRRFEAVIIIGRAMSRSFRALWVLVLNITMTTLIFGAVIFFVEQGTYDSDTGYYMRPSGIWVLNPNTSRWEEEWERSPFQSIPHSFWWALVTATTVGYGDVTPTSIAGKVCAGMAMVWSLCVLALPIGVIGSNFELVWQEYDTEKAMERDLKNSERLMVRQTLGSIDPLTFSRLFHVEIFHDSQMATEENDIFIGEAEIELDVRPHSRERVYCQRRLRLEENRAKSNRKITGTVYVNYMWTPSEHDHGMLLNGVLDVEVVKAEGLVDVDWKGSGLSDPYLRATAFPRSPGKDGVVHPERKRTRTLIDAKCPNWHEKFSFRFRWHQEGVVAKKELDRKNSAHGFTGMYSPFGYVQMCSTLSNDANQALQGSDRPRRNSDPRSDHSQSLSVDKGVMAVLPQLQLDVAELQREIPKLQSEVQQLREGTRAILGLLGASPSRALVPCGASNGTDAADWPIAGSNGGNSHIHLSGRHGSGVVGAVGGNGAQAEILEISTASTLRMSVASSNFDDRTPLMYSDDSTDFSGPFRTLQVPSHGDGKERVAGLDSQCPIPGAVPEEGSRRPAAHAISGRGVVNATNGGYGSSGGFPGHISSRSGVEAVGVGFGGGGDAAAGGWTSPHTPLAT